MKEKIKLTELTKDELRQVRGGIGGNMGIVKSRCTSSCEDTKQQVFGVEDSIPTILSPKPITRPPIVVRP